MLVAPYNTKKELKSSIGEKLKYIETSIISNEYHGDGEYTVAGPSPYNRKWYGIVEVKDGVISKVK